MALIRKPKNSASETKTETAKVAKAAAPVANKASVGFLESLASKKPETKKSKTNDEIIPLSVPAQHAIDRWAEHSLKAKELKGILAECENIIFPEAEPIRVAMSQGLHEHKSSVKVGGGKTSVTYVKKNAYTGISIGDKAEAIAAIAAVDPRGENEEEITAAADAMLASRITWETTVSLKPGALENPVVVAILQKHLAEFLVVEMVGTPTEQFHEGSTLNPDEAVYMKALVDAGLLKPHKASLRISGSSD